MSRQGRSAAAVVHRNYAPDVNHCIQAIAMLLKKPRNKEGSPNLATLKSTRGEVAYDSRTDKSISN
jgi:hypothetical protein